MADRRISQWVSLAGLLLLSGLLVGCQSTADYSDSNDGGNSEFVDDVRGLVDQSQPRIARDSERGQSGWEGCFDPSDRSDGEFRGADN
jgi:hypothetical protein